MLVKWLWSRPVVVLCQPLYVQHWRRLGPRTLCCQSGLYLFHASEWSTYPATALAPRFHCGDTTSWGSKRYLCRKDLRTHPEKLGKQWARIHWMPCLEGEKNGDFILVVLIAAAGCYWQEWGDARLPCISPNCHVQPSGHLTLIGCLYNHSIAIITILSRREESHACCFRTIR